MTSVQILHDAFASLLYPFGDKFREAEVRLSQLEHEPEFVTQLLELILNSSVEIGVRRLGAVYLKNKITRSWSPRSADTFGDGTKHVFKSHLVRAIMVCHPSLREFLIICLSKIMDYDYQESKWPELIPETTQLLKNTEDLTSITAGLQILKQICKFYRWNSVKVNKQISPLMSSLFPHILEIAEASVSALEASAADASGVDPIAYYELIYEVLKIYKLSTTRFLPEVFREESIAKRTVGLFLRVFVLPLPASVSSVYPASERAGLLPVKCQKWATANIVRTHNNYLTKSYSQLSENASQYAPYRQLFINVFAPEVTKLYIERLRVWSQRETWFSNSVLHNIITYLDAMIDFKQIFTDIILPRLDGLLGQVLFPLMCPTEDDLDLFEDDPVEFVQRQVDLNAISTPSHVAAQFINHIVRKRKSTLPLVMEFLHQCCKNFANQPDAIKQRVGMFELIQALGPVFMGKSSQYRQELDPILTQFVIPDLSSAHAYLRNEACNTMYCMSSLGIESRETVQHLFQSVLQCFFDAENLPVQVAAAQLLQSLSDDENNHDIRAALRQHITDIISNLLAITKKIDLESLLNVLDHFVGLFPDQITPFATDLAAQLCQQFITLAAELAESQRQVNESGGIGAVAESEVMMLTNEKTNAGYSIMNSLANLQNNLEHQRELTVKLDEAIAPVFMAVYENQLMDFYPDCLSLHENTLFTMKIVPEHHWRYFSLLIDILKMSRFDYFEDAMPVLENYILYGSSFLAQNPPLLVKFTELLVSFYAPSENKSEYQEASAIFTDARTRAHVMSTTSKLLVSSSLFNGPLLPYIQPLIDAVIQRVSADNQNTAATFPPRYNVATVSLVLSGLYHDPEKTLLVLHSRSAVDSFFETWFQTLQEFTRVNDLKLCVMAVLSLLSYQTAHPDVELGSVLPQLVKVLIHSLGVLPGAASRVAEMMKNEDSGLWDDDADFNELDDEYDEDFDAGENDASAEYGDQMPESASVVNASGDGNFMYEFPGGQASAGAATTAQDDEPDEASRSALRSALISQMGFIADDFDEDMYSVSPLDSLNPYDALRSVVSGLESSKPEFYQKLMNLFSESDKAMLQESMQRTSLPDYSPVNSK